MIKIREKYLPPMDKFFFQFMALFFLSLVSLWILSSYFQVDIFKLVSGPSLDVPGNLIPGNTILGQHSFGDYLLPLEYAKKSNFWINSIEPGNTYPPIAMILYKLFSFFNLEVGFYLFLGLSFLSIIYPSIDIYMNYSRKTGMQLMFISLLSIGSVTTFDRGNNIGLLVTPLYFFMKSSNQTIKNLLLSVAVMIKIYPIILLLIDFKLKSLKIYFAIYAFWTLVIIYIINKQGNPFLKTLSQMKEAYKPYDFKIVEQGNLSLHSSVGQIISIFNLIQQPDTFVNLIIELTSNRYLYVIILVVLFITMIKSHKIQLGVKYLFSIYIMWAVVPITFAYTTILLLAPIANLIVKGDFENLLNYRAENNKINYKNIFLIYTLLITLVPGVIYINGYNLKFSLVTILWTLIFISHLFGQNKLIAYKKFEIS